MLCTSCVRFVDIPSHFWAWAACPPGLGVLHGRGNAELPPVPSAEHVRRLDRTMPSTIARASSCVNSLACSSVALRMNSETLSGARNADLSRGARILSTTLPAVQGPSSGFGAMSMMLCVSSGTGFDGARDCPATSRSAPRLTVASDTQWDPAASRCGATSDCWSLTAAIDLGSSNGNRPTGRTLPSGPPSRCDLRVVVPSCSALRPALAAVGWP